MAQQKDFNTPKIFQELKIWLSPKSWRLKKIQKNSDFFCLESVPGHFKKKLFRPGQAKDIRKTATSLELAKAEQDVEQELLSKKLVLRSRVDAVSRGEANNQFTCTGGQLYLVCFGLEALNSFKGCATRLL